MDVAEKLGIELEVLDYSAQFRKIIDYFVEEYTAGRTPNPCVICNRDLKFGALFKHAEKLGCDAVATGHYARIVEREGRRFLARGLDPGKDQSYFLFSLTGNQLKRTMFPCGELVKDQVREIAAEIGRKYLVNKVAIYHRVGKLNVGDVNLVVAIAAAHRGEGFAASQAAIGLFKEKLPTRKKETYTDGSVWTGD